MKKYFITVNNIVCFEIQNRHDAHIVYDILRKSASVEKLELAESDEEDEQLFEITREF